MPSPKDRQNSGISMLEKEQAEGHLRTALRAVNLHSAMSPIAWEIRTAMAILGMEEHPYCEHCKCHHADRGPWIGHIDRIPPGATVIDTSTGDVHQEPGKWGT